MGRMYRGRRRDRCGKEWIWIPFLAFFFVGVLTAQAADNAECLKCHKNSLLSKGKKDGSLLSLHVDEEAFKTSVHGAAGMGCTDCHQEAQPTFHPAEGFPPVGCANCHADAVETYKKTTHGLVLESGLERAPKCQDCHTSHYIRKINDPQSPVHPSHISTACSKCHEEAKPPRGWLVALATYRITGHPKADLAARYDTQGCANCHPDNAGHPQKQVTPVCLNCHDRSAQTPLLLGPVHFKMSFQEQPVPFILRILYGTGIIVGIVGCAVFFSYRAYRRRKNRKPHSDKAGEEEKT